MGIRFSFLWWTSCCQQSTKRRNRTYVPCMRQPFPHCCLLHVKCHNNTNTPHVGSLSDKISVHSIESKKLCLFIVWLNNHFENLLQSLFCSIHTTLQFLVRNGNSSLTMTHTHSQYTHSTVTVFLYCDFKVLPCFKYDTRPSSL